MLEALLPADVVAVEAFGDASDAVLFPEGQRGRQASARVHDRPPLRPAGAGAPELSANTRAVRRRPRTPVASRCGRQHHPLRRLPRGSRRSRRPDRVSRCRCRAERTAARRGGRFHRIAGRGGLDGGAALGGAGGVLGPAPVQRQGVGVQGVVSARPAMAGLRGSGHPGGPRGWLLHRATARARSGGRGSDADRVCRPVARAAWSRRHGGHGAYPTGTSTTKHDR